MSPSESKVYQIVIELPMDMRLGEVIDRTGLPKDVVETCIENLISDGYFRRATDAELQAHDLRQAYMRLAKYAVRPQERKRVG